MKLIKSSNQFYAHVGDETVRLDQNLEAKNGDHWKLDIYLERWRSKAELIKLLRGVIAVVESAP